MGDGNIGNWLKFGSAIAVALLSAYFAYRRAKRDQDTKSEQIEREATRRQVEMQTAFDHQILALKAEKELTQKQQLDQQLNKFNGLILLSAADLQDRLWHLTSRQAKAASPVLLKEDENQAASSNWPMTKQHYLTSTVYLFARFWCWIEVLNQTIRFLDFGDDDRTKAFRNTVKRTERALAETKLQKASTVKIRSDRPIFQMQQALMGQALMIGATDVPDCMTYADFTENYASLATRFPDFRDLEALLVGAMTAEDQHFHLRRLRIFANQLVCIIELLDPQAKLIAPNDRELVPLSKIRKAELEKILATEEPG